MPHYEPHHVTLSAIRTAVIRCTCILITALLTCTGSALATTLSHDELIGHYDTTISKIERTIGAAKARRTALIERLDALGTNLKEVETETTTTTVNNPTLEGEIQQLTQELETLESQLRQRQDELTEQRQQGENLPIPGVIADALADDTALQQHRALALWQYRMHLKKQKLAALSDKKSRLQANIDATSARNDTIRTSIQKLTEQQESLSRDRQSIEERFSKISADIVRQQDRVDRMVKRRQSLREDPARSTSFAGFKGNLPDPTEGTLSKSYAEPKAEGLLKWDGILVNAPLGQEIEAIFDGRVVFAGEIQGLGNVAIIEHDTDFMTLYGMAELLVIEEQQTVIAGQVIGTVGESVGNDAPALYFEIRRNAETVNPEEWLSMTAISSAE